MIKNSRYKCFRDSNCLNTRTVEVEAESKILNASSLVTTTIVNLNIGEVENNIHNPEFNNS